MSDTPCLFDQGLLRARLKRALHEGPADFLLTRAADDLAERLDAILRSFDNVLDLATPGPHAVEVLATSGKAQHVLQAPPLDELAAPYPDIEQVTLDPALLAIEPKSLDAIVSLLALHTVDDLPGTFIQIRRALKDDGLFLACIPGGQTLHELRTALSEAEIEIEGGVSPRVFPFADVRDLGGLLQRAGFALPVADSETVTVRYADPLQLLRDLRAMGATNILNARRKTFFKRATLFRAFEIYQKKFSDADGRVRATFELVWISGWTPHASQQKPLKPGSAAMRLAEALKTDEISTGEKPN